jgi:glycerol-3-phosphate acyltransferase PlsY
MKATRRVSLGMRRRASVTLSARRFVPAAAAGYLFGSLPSADLAGRLASPALPRDLRDEGSGNPGALNAAQVLGWRWGLGVLAADVGKGAAAALLGRAVGGDEGAYAAATAAIAGHVAPPWSKFRGGKGIATSAGACLAVFPAYFPIDVGVAAVTATASRDATSTIRWSCAVWTTAALLWWRRQLPNAWGPKPSAALPVFAALGSAIILARVGIKGGSR